MLVELEGVSDRANALFNERIAPLVAGQDPGLFLAIDIVSGDYETGTDDLPTEARLKARHADAVIYVRRVGDDTAYYVGGGYQH